MAVVQAQFLVKNPNLADQFPRYNRRGRRLTGNPAFPYGLKLNGEPAKRPGRKSRQEKALLQAEEAEDDEVKEEDDDGLTIVHLAGGDQDSTDSNPSMGDSSSDYEPNMLNRMLPVLFSLFFSIIVYTFSSSML